MGLDLILNTILEKIRLVKQRHPMISCYIVGDFNVNLNDESLPKSRALRSFAAAGQLTEMTAELPTTWRGVRGNTVSFSKLDHIFTDNVARLEAGSFPNPDSDHHVVYVKPFPKEKIRDPDPPPFEFHSTKILKGKTNSQMFAKQVASEVYQEYMLPDESVLLGRLQENSDVSHPSFIPNMEDFFLNRVDKNPIEKFNIISGKLSKQITKKVKDEKKTYLKAQKKYQKWEENLGKKNERLEFTAQEEFRDVLQSISNSKNEFSKKKKLSKVSKSLHSYHF